MPRYDKVWTVQKVGASHLGPVLLGGKLQRFHRNEQKAVETNQRKGKRDIIVSKKSIENSDFFKPFRAQCLFIWKRFLTLVKRPERKEASNSLQYSQVKRYKMSREQGGEDEADGNDEDENGDDIDTLYYLNKKLDDAATEVIPFNPNLSPAKYVELLNKEMNARREQRAWHVERTKDRAAMSEPPFRIRRRVSVTMLFDQSALVPGTKDARIEYFVKKKYRLPPTSRSIPQEAEEEVIYEEEEDDPELARERFEMIKWPEPKPVKKQLKKQVKNPTKKKLKD
jgi:hypothetical protein